MLNKLSHGDVFVRIYNSLGVAIDATGPGDVPIDAVEVLAERVGTTVFRNDDLKDTSMGGRFLLAIRESFSPSKNRLPRYSIGFNGDYGFTDGSGTQTSCRGFGNTEAAAARDFLNKMAKIFSDHQIRTNQFLTEGILKPEKLGPCEIIVNGRSFPIMTATGDLLPTSHRPPEQGFRYKLPPGFVQA
ncbi:MAG: hypothetical protein EB059_02105 [Alphaproteobacteria bacterium]|nr:hypothetical protein [Alphaproteobacteria bacterium]